MRKARFTEHQIIAVLKSVEAGRTVKDVCREAGISEASYYNWKAKFGGMEASDIKKMKDLEDENRRLKQMTLNEAREITERWLAEYNGERPHESLNNLTPEEYRLMAETPEISKSAWN
ncbi:transposase [Klebsiella quasipneumoniae subsp. quasipneumoniae]